MEKRLRKEKILQGSMKLTRNANVTCKTENVLYCIQCPTCHQIYIGQTVKLCRDREHSVRDTPCSGLFANCGQGFKKKIFL